MIKYIRNIIHRKNVTIDCSIINNFEEKIKLFKSIKSYFEIFIDLLNEPYTNNIFFKVIVRKYEFDKAQTCNVNLKLVISMNKKREINLVLFTSDEYNSNYEECINIIITNSCKIKSFRSAKHNFNLISVMIDMLLVEYNRIYEISFLRGNSYNKILPKNSNYIQECI